MSVGAVLGAEPRPQGCRGPGSTEDTQPSGGQGPRGLSPQTVRQLGRAA